MTSDITKEYIDRFITEEKPESRFLDYKQKLPGNSDKDKKDFLADVSSFANSSGGELIYGIEEKRDDNNNTTGIPDSATGLKDANPDQEKQRLENMIISGIQPRIPGFRIEEVPGFPDGPVIVLSIPRSWAAPHMISYQDWNRFYARTSSRNYPLDVGQIRAAFAQSDSLYDRIHRFRSDRISAILADETPDLLKNGPKLIIHVLPYSAFDPTMQIDITENIEGYQLNYIKPIGKADTFQRRYNFDGFVCSNYNIGYVQVYRKGIIEMVDTYIVGGQIESQFGPGCKFIVGPSFEIEIIDAIQRLFYFLEDKEIDMPVIICASIINIINYKISRECEGSMSNPFQSIDRDSLVLPPVTINELPDREKIIESLHQVFNMFWQSAGWPESPCYNNNQWNYVAMYYRITDKYGPKKYESK